MNQARRKPNQAPSLNLIFGTIVPPRLTRIMPRKMITELVAFEAVVTLPPVAELKIAVNAPEMPVLREVGLPVTADQLHAVIVAVVSTNDIDFI